MAWDDLMQKAFYFGVGLAAYAGEKAGVKLGEWSAQTQQAIQDLVARGEITTDEARRMVEDLIQTQQGGTASDPPASTTSNPAPRPIEIVQETEMPGAAAAPTTDPEILRLRQEAQTLQRQLQNLRESQD